MLQLAAISWFNQLPPLMQVLLIVFLAIVGGCVGSFMNVVVWRMPRGKSLLYPGSACPRCGHAIRSWHNIPVLGWLILGGKCHDCGQPISARYPRVEAFVMAMFLVFAFAGPLSMTEDARPVDPFKNLDPAVKQQLQAQYIPPADAGQGSGELGRAGGKFALDMLLLCTLLCGALIQWDAAPPQELRFPKLLFLVPWLVTVVAAVGWPALAAGETDDLSRAAALGQVASGTLAGAGVALLAWPMLAAGPLGAAGRAYGIAGTALVGAALGVQAVLWTCAVAAIGYFACCDLARHLWAGLKWLSWPHLLWAATAGHLLVAEYVAIRSMWLCLGLIILCSICFWLTDRAKRSS